MASGTGRRPPSQKEAEAVVESVAAEAEAEAVEATTEVMMEAIQDAADDIHQGAPVDEVLRSVHALAASMHRFAEQMATRSEQAPTPSYSDRLLDVIAARMSTPPAQSMTEAQARTMLSYRLLRNGLGNYGGHGDGFDSAWVLMTYYPSVNELTLSGLPPSSVWVRPYFTSSSGDVQPGHDVTVSNPNDAVNIDPPQAERGKPPFSAISVVEVLDRSKLAIAAGLPSVVPTDAHRGPAYPGPVDY